MRRIIIAGTIILCGTVLWCTLPVSGRAASPAAGIVLAHLKGVHPLLNGDCRLIGGMVDGKWQDRAKIASLLKGGETYRFFSRQREPWCCCPAAGIARRLSWRSMTKG